MLRLEPELVWLDGRFRRDTAVVVDPGTGRIVAVHGSTSGGGSAVGPSSSWGGSGDEGAGTSSREIDTPGEDA